MTPMLFTAVAVAGGLGGVARLVLDDAVSSRTDGTLPWGTIVVNLSGSLMLGLIAGLVSGRVLPDAWQVVAGVGFLGGFTTFSAASFETVRLLQEGRRTAGMVNGLGILVAATAAAGLGLWIGSVF